MVILKVFFVDHSILNTDVEDGSTIFLIFELRMPRPASIIFIVLQGHCHS